MTSEPTILLKHAELLHVALSTVVHVLETRTDYPVDNIESILRSYRFSREKHLYAQGLKKKQIDAYTAAATEAIVAWLEDKERLKSSTEADFDAWTQELMDE